MTKQYTQYLIIIKDVYLERNAFMTILYIDDDEEDREIFCEAVNVVNPSVKCVAVSGASVGLQTIRVQPVDIIFLDYRMPVMDGKSFLQSLQELNLIKKPRIFLYSTFMNEFEMADCRALGVDDCINKPGHTMDFCRVRNDIYAFVNSPVKKKSSETSAPSLTQ
jgi:CheY-like chemotaxis protein